MLEWLRLFRFAGLCTIASNTLATVAVAYYPSGLNMWGLAAQLRDSGINVLWVWITSVLLYFTGMLWNDFSDIERDRELNPNRPLPAGLISYKSAAIAALLLPVLIMLSAAMLGERGFYMAGIVLVFIMAYNTAGKQIPYLGSLLMACVRLSHAFFVLLYLGDDTFDRVILSFFGIGSSVESSVQADGILNIYPLLLFIYILGLTIISELESRRGTRLELLVGGGLIGVAFLACIYKLISSHWVVGLLNDRSFALGFVSVVILLGAVIYTIRRVMTPWLIALREARADLIGSVVIKGLGGIIFFDALIAACHHPVLGILCLCLYPIFLVSARITAMD